MRLYAGYAQSMTLARSVCESLSASVCVCVCGSHKCAADKRKDTAKDAGCQTASRGADSGTVGQRDGRVGKTSCSFWLVSGFGSVCGCFLGLVRLLHLAGGMQQQ